MASSNRRTVRVVEICQVRPSLLSPESATEFSLPLTFFDTFWFKFHPVERIFFYAFPDSSPSIFNSDILAQLKHTLSLALLHFLPLAGHLTWPPDAVKPFIFYNPNSSSVSLSVAESDADFHHLSEDRVREAVESHPYIPQLDVSETQSAIIAFQITLFPHQGFCIGVSSHHAILDGKTVTMFMKAWASLCKQSTQEKKSNPSLPPELTPFFDRTSIHDPEGIDVIYLNNWTDLWSRLVSDHNPRSLKLLLFPVPTNSNLLRGTFNLSLENINKLRQKVMLQYQFDKDAKDFHLSTFVLAYAYIVSVLAKAKGLEKYTRVLLAFTADCRARLDPPIPENYFGNCLSSYAVQTNAEVLMAENGLASAAERLSDLIIELEKGALIGAKEKLARFMKMDPATSIEKIGVAGSPRFLVYTADFGWGRPKKVEITSIDKTGSISMAESGDGSGGVETDVVLKKHEMELFDSLFFKDL